ncbi:uncharacterized protein LOC110185324 [Drosophila serrata]|uniref:uncharacterized protein LOC110185324 n=1 Tax=Drosophila serrata TaxID=7274 RepID=UPI000A1D3880|nr:uncharacterized protein LOC110185324 [Drosophila serrata]
MSSISFSLLVLTQGVNMWNFVAGDLHPIYQVVLSFFLMGIGVMGVISLRRKWKERDMVMMAMPESLVEDVLPIPEPLPIELEELPLVTKVSLLPESNTTIDQDDFQLEPEIPQPIPQTMAKPNPKEAKPQQMRKTKIPVINSKTSRVPAGIIKKDQPQTSQKVVPQSVHLLLLGPVPNPVPG